MRWCKRLPIVVVVALENTEKKKKVRLIVVVVATRGEDRAVRPRKVSRSHREEEGRRSKNVLCHHNHHDH